jgi:hypothetical protein
VRGLFSLAILLSVWALVVILCSDVLYHGFPDNNHWHLRSAIAGQLLILRCFRVDEMTYEMEKLDYENMWCPYEVSLVIDLSMVGQGISYH